MKKVAICISGQYRKSGQPMDNLLKPAFFSLIPPGFLKLPPLLLSSESFWHGYFFRLALFFCFYHRNLSKP